MVVDESDDLGSNRVVGCGERQTFAYRRPTKSHSSSQKGKDYLKLVDWTGKNIAKPNKASIGRHRPPILNRLGIDSGPWVSTMKPSGNVFTRAIGGFKRMRSHAWSIGQEWIRGIRLSKKTFRTG